MNLDVSTNDPFAQPMAEGEVMHLKTVAFAIRFGNAGGAEFDNRNRNIVDEKLWVLYFGRVWLYDFTFKMLIMSHIFHL